MLDSNTCLTVRQGLLMTDDDTPLKQIAGYLHNALYSVRYPEKNKQTIANIKAALKLAMETEKNG